MPMTTAALARALLTKIGRYVEFDYEPIPECRRPMTPSKAAALEDTVMVAPPGKVRGWIEDEGKVRITKEGHWVVTLRNINRKKRLPTGQGYYRDKSKNEYLWRTYRLAGIDIESILYNAGRGRGKTVLFRNPEREAAIAGFGV